jgi:hypothetical protein
MSKRVACVAHADKEKPWKYQKWMLITYPKWRSEASPITKHLQVLIWNICRVHCWRPKLSWNAEETGPLCIVHLSFPTLDAQYSKVMQSIQEPCSLLLCFNITNTKCIFVKGYKAVVPQTSWWGIWMLLTIYTWCELLSSIPSPITMFVNCTCIPKCMSNKEQRQNSRTQNLTQKNKWNKKWQILGNLKILEHNIYNIIINSANVIL